MNGFSNDYWGWGGEDDDFSTRVSLAGYSIVRYPTMIARYKMIKHMAESANPVNKCRWKIMKKTKKRWKTGESPELNRIKYGLKIGSKFEFLEQLIVKFCSNFHFKALTK